MGKGKRIGSSVAEEGGGFVLTSMIDVTFLLIIFFMCVTELADNSRADVILPAAEKTVPDDYCGRLVINVTRGGERVIMGRTYDDGLLNRLLGAESEAGQESGGVLPSRAVLIRADEAAEYSAVESVLKLCMENRLWRVSFAAREDCVR